jgi:hypothetical protein
VPIRNCGEKVRSAIFGVTLFGFDAVKVLESGLSRVARKI